MGCSAALNLNVDRVALAYSDGTTLGDPASPVRMESTVRGRAPIPAWAMPEVVTRSGIDLEPLDVTGPDDARWLRACLWPEQREQAERLDAEMALAATAPPLLLRGGAAELLPDAVACVPANALPVVITTWALAQFSDEARLRFLDRLDEAATRPPVAWVSVEGVGIAPAIPSLGDRRGSGHSIIGLAVFEHSALRAEVAGRYWSRGRWLAFST